MLKLRNVLVTGLTIIIANATLAGIVKANEGVLEFKSVSGDESRCFALSVLMPDYKYQITVSCAGLVYPAGPGEYKYALWFNPASGKKAVRVGDLGVGKASFKVNEAFYSMYITKEGPKDSSGNPSQTVVMRANVARIRFLETGVSGQYGDCVVKEPMEVVTPGAGQNTTITPTKSQSKGQVDVAPVLRVGITVLRILGIVLVAGFVAVLIVVAVSSFGGRKKGPPGI